jgi:negative regulator of replication initiation
MSGIDSDSGSGFINDLLHRYGLVEQILFTRSRPYEKNDQAHVKQKNWSTVYHTIGYDLFETDDECLLVDTIDTDLRLCVNFFQPMLKLVGKVQMDGRTVKPYNQPATPYWRVLVSNQVSLQDKAKLTNLYLQLNPVTFRRRINITIGKL